MGTRIVIQDRTDPLALRTLEKPHLHLGSNIQPQENRKLSPHTIIDHMIMTILFGHQQKGGIFHLGPIYFC